MKYGLFFYFGFFISIISCNNQNTSQDNYSKYMNNHLEVKNKKIAVDIFKLKHKPTLIFTGFSDCSSCILTLKEIQNLKDSKIIKSSIQIIYVANGLESEYFDYQIHKIKFSFPIIIDENKSFINKNNLYDYSRSTILLNKENRVVLVGDIFDNEKTFNLYKSVLDTL